MTSATWIQFVGPEGMWTDAVADDARPTDSDGLQEASRAA